MKNYLSTKRGKPVKPSRWAWTGFHWFGRDDHGVSIWSGDKRTLYWCSKLMFGIGVVEMTASAILFFERQWEPAAVFGPMGALFLGIAWYMRKHYAWINSLATVDQVAADLGVDRDQLDELTAGRDISPRMIMNGVAYYSADDVGETARLLRASGAPSPEHLLRAAGCAKTDDATLLQPAPLPEADVDLLGQVRRSHERPSVTDELHQGAEVTLDSRNA